MKICVYDGSVLFFSYFIICSIPVVMLLSDKSWTDLIDHGYLVFINTEVGRHVDMTGLLPTYAYMLTHLRRFFFSLVRYISRDGHFRIYWDKNIYFWMGILFLVSQLSIRGRPYESDLFCQFLVSKNIRSPDYHLDESCDWKISLHLEFSPERNTQLVSLSGYLVNLPLVNLGFAMTIKYDIQCLCA